MQAFSIDDSATTEIDDALSVQGLGSGTVMFGIHIAAPGLALAPDSALDKVARERLSTVYMPGWKLTMLPDEVVQAYTLIEGRDCPAVSLYVTFDEATLERARPARPGSSACRSRPTCATTSSTRVITEASLARRGAGRLRASPPNWPSPSAWRAHLKAQREVVRGKPENFNRPDYNFRLEGNDGGEPHGDEQVPISTRQRGAPLDLIVAEAMILANSTWGGWLAELRRARHLPQPGQPGAGREGAHGHQGRAARRHGRGAVHLGHLAAAPLCRPGQPVADHRLRAPRPHRRAGRAVQAARTRSCSPSSRASTRPTRAYNDFQHGIERYWTLR